MASFKPGAGFAVRHWNHVRRVLAPVPDHASLHRGLRVVLTAFHRLLQKSWFVLRPRNFGAHAVALTPAGRIVLVKLRYAQGWRLPGGRRRKGEAPEVTILRELREEIGMTRFAEMERACDLVPERKAELASVLVVTGVEYRRPRWSLEVEDVLEASANGLPADLAPPAERWLGAVLPALQPAAMMRGARDEPWQPNSLT